LRKKEFGGSAYYSEWPKVADAVIEAELSLGYIHACFLWAHEQINMETHWDFVRANFSGVLCLDEVHDSGRTILFATDPLGNFTVSFKLVEHNDQDHMDTFLQALKDRGLDAQVVITDGSPLYKDALQRYWSEVEHQLNCVSFTSSRR
jgi:transposase-like protein